jgi:hypothetical protein
MELKLVPYKTFISANQNVNKEQLYKTLTNRVITNHIKNLHLNTKSVYINYPHKIDSVVKLASSYQGL